MMAERFIANYFARSWKTGVSIAVSLSFSRLEIGERDEKRDSLHEWLVIMICSIRLEYFYGSFAY